MAKVWAHRGASAYAPENTIEAYELARKMGADGIELDVQLSSDGVPVIMHDEDVRRVSGAQGAVGALSLQQLKALDVSCGMAGYAGVRIPTLDEVLIYLEGNDLYLNIEIKNGIVLYEDIEKKVVALVHAHGLADRVIYSSFNHYSLMLVRREDPGARIGLLYSEAMVDPHIYAKHLGAEAIHPFDKTLLVPGTVENCLRCGVQVNPWTVNRDEDMRRLAKLGCHALITNYPDIARRVVDEIDK